MTTYHPTWWCWESNPVCFVERIEHFWQLSQADSSPGIIGLMCRTPDHPAPLYLFAFNFYLKVSGLLCFVTRESVYFVNLFPFTLNYYVLYKMIVTYIFHHTFADPDFFFYSVTKIMLNYVYLYIYKIHPVYHHLLICEGSKWWHINSCTKYTFRNWKS